jgi:uncharacterized protein DUF6894
MMSALTRRIGRQAASKEKRMPRYLFHLCRDGVRFPDSKGQQLDDADQAWEAAKATALGLMNAEANGTAVWSASHFEVTNEQNEVVFEFPFTEAVRVRSQPS